VASLCEGRICGLFCVPRYNAVQPVESQPTFLSNMSLPSSGLKNKPSKKSAFKCNQVKLNSCSFLLWLPLQSWWSGRHVLPKRRLTFNKLHDFYMPEYRALHNHTRDNLKSYNEYADTVTWHIYIMNKFTICAFRWNRTKVHCTKQETKVPFGARFNGKRLLAYPRLSCEGNVDSGLIV
jgi:hypothetical protein